MDQALRDKRLKRLEPASPDTARSAPQDSALGGCRAPEWPAHLTAFARTERHSLLALEGSAHTRLRRRSALAFSSRRSNALAESIRDVAHQAVDTVASQATADLLPLWASQVPVTVIARLLGVPDDQREQLLTWSHAMVRVYTMTQSRAEEDAAEAAAAAFESCLLEIVRARRKAPLDDLISDFCALSGEDTMSDEEIVSTAILLLNAGHEATVHQLGNAVVTLLEHPQLNPATLLATTDSTTRTVQELGRYRTPLHLFTRYAQQDMDIGHGVHLRRGEQLGLLLGAANHDPKKFAAPWTFNPIREDGANLGFGAGVHFCLGVHLARLEIGIALQVLFERLPKLTLAEPVSVSDTWHFHGLDSLLVHPHGS